MDPIDIYLIRHGMTAGNREKRYIGITDEPLCEEGLQMLNPLSLELPVHQVIVSPLLRCRQTAKALFPAAEQIVTPDLAEMDFGIFENRKFSGDLEYSPEYQAWLDSFCEDPVPGGESKKDFEQRCLRGFHSALQQIRPGEPAVFVVHGGTVMSILGRYASPRREYYEWNPANGHGFRGKWNGNCISDIGQI